MQTEIEQIVSYYPDRPRRVLFLFSHRASGVLCLQPDYFIDLQEAQDFYAKYTGSHIEPIMLWEAPRSGYSQAGVFYPYDEPRPDLEP